MSKATFKHQFRACLFRVACVDWQGNPHARGMSRLYSVSLQWEMFDRTGSLSGVFDSPVGLIFDAQPWSVVVETVRSHLRLAIELHAFGGSWTPFYMVTGDACSCRLVKELRSLIADEHSFEGDEGLAKSVPRTCPPDSVF